MKSDFNKGLEIGESSKIKGFLSKNHPMYFLAQELVIRGFSARTIKTYLAINQRFLRYTGKSAKCITGFDIKDYLLYLKSRNLTNTSLNLVISALKFYYLQVLNRKLFFNIIRPRREKTLPVVLSMFEINKIIDATHNLKHKLLLSLMYGSGLRVSEVVKLKIIDFDLVSQRLFIRKSKGNKDRWTILSKFSIKLFSEYIKGLPENYLFLFSGNGSSHLTVRSAQKIFNNSLKKASLQKKASCHSLRHSFATHLLENNTQINIIQKLLGHSNLKTTQGYLKISNKYLGSIKSPLDRFEVIK